MDFDVYNVLSNDNNIINEQLNLQHNSLGGLNRMEKQLHRQIRRELQDVKKEESPRVVEPFAAPMKMIQNDSNNNNVCTCPNCNQQVILEQKLLLILVFILSIVCLNQYFTYQQTMSDMKFALMMMHPGNGNVVMQQPSVVQAVS